MDKKEAIEILDKLRYLFGDIVAEGTYSKDIDAINAKDDNQKIVDALSVAIESMAE